MGSGRKWALGLFLVIIIAVIVLTWGSIASAVMTLALLVIGSFVALKYGMFRQEDYFNDERGV